MQKIRDDINRRDFNKEEGAVKKIAARVKGEVDKEMVENICADIIAVSEELKRYTMSALRAEDFIFTDWEKEDPGRGIYGPEEIKRRIDDYLEKSRIRD